MILGLKGFVFFKLYVDGCVRKEVVYWISFFSSKVVNKWCVMMSGSSERFWNRNVEKQ